MNDTLTSLAQLLGAGTLGAVLLKVVEQFFKRAESRDQLAVGLRGEMLRRLEALEHQLGDLERRERDQYRRGVRLEAENRQLRRRYHDLLTWLAAQPGLPTPPTWLHQRIEGPTQDEGDGRPSTGEAP